MSHSWLLLEQEAEPYRDVAFSDGFTDYLTAEIAAAQGAGDADRQLKCGGRKNRSPRDGNPGRAVVAPATAVLVGRLLLLLLRALALLSPREASPSRAHSFTCEDVLRSATATHRFVCPCRRASTAASQARQA